MQHLTYVNKCYYVRSKRLQTGPALCDYRQKAAASRAIIAKNPVKTRSFTGKFALLQRSERLTSLTKYNYNSVSLGAAAFFKGCGNG